MRDAWLLLRTIGWPGGCREHGTRASIWFSLPSSLGRAAPRPCSRWPSALEDPCRVWSWDELGGNSKRKGGQAGHVGGSEYDGRYAEAFVASSQVHVDATERM